MIRLLNEREQGVLDPLLLRRAEITRRNSKLELSKLDVEGIHKGCINSLDIDVVENRYLLSGGAEAAIVIYDIQTPSSGSKETYKHVCQASCDANGEHKHSVETVQWYPMDTGMFSSSGSDYQLKIWDTNRMKVADKYTFSGLVYNHHMSTIAQKHCLIAVGCDRSIVKLVDMKAGAATHLLKGHSGAVTSVKWSSREEFLLATGGVDNKVLIWDIRRAKGHLMALDQHNGQSASSAGKSKLAHDGAVTSIQYTNDGLFLLTFGTDNRARLWNSATGRNVLVNYGTIFNASKKCQQIAISSGASHEAVFIPSEGNIEVLDLHSGSHLVTLRGHYNYVSCCVYQKDFHYLFSGGSDRNILVWQPNTVMCDYEEHLQSEMSETQKQKSLRKHIMATVDTWSSDEEK